MTNLVAQVAIICAGPLQFGLHMSELNAPLPYMPCTASKDCIAGIGDGASASSSFAIGGLVGSLAAGSLSDKYGRKTILHAGSILFLLGSLVAASSHHNQQLVVGRLISGLAAGAAIVVGPMFISEISPPEYRGLFGACSQISVNTGILLTQFLGVLWAQHNWRRIIWAGVVAAVVQFIGLIFAPESPKWHALARTDETVREPQTSIVAYLTQKQYRKSLILAASIMCIQQFSGINAIIFYGVSILKKSIPQNSELINLGLSLLNLAVTAASARFIDLYGRQRLMVFSLLGMAFGTGLLGFSLGSHLSTVSALAAMIVIAAFATGLGPIPFLLIAELTSPEALGVAQSVGTTFNWLATFMIGALFPLVERALGAHVWYIFTSMCIFGAWVCLRFLTH